jgi:hypothetical protein
MCCANGLKACTGKEHTDGAAGPLLPLIPHAALAPRDAALAHRSSGELDFMIWIPKGVTVAVKRNGTTSADTAAIDNDRRLFGRLLHDNILPVHGICVNAPDGKVRLVMKYCENGSLDSYLSDVVKHEVCCRVTNGGGGLDRG